VTWNNYEEVAKFAREHPSKSKLANNTYLIKHEDGSYGIKLHKTEVVVFEPSGKIILNSGGWDTLTTRARITDYSPFRAWRHYGRTFIWHPSRGHFWFEDGMYFPYWGNCYDPVGNEIESISSEKFRVYKREYIKEHATPYKYTWRTCSCCKRESERRIYMTKIRNRLHCPGCVKEGYVIIEGDGKLDCARCRHRKVDVLFE
jgi:hypothetical protein